MESNFNNWDDVTIAGYRKIYAKKNAERNGVIKDVDKWSKPQ